MISIVNPTKISGFFAYSSSFCKAPFFFHHTKPPTAPPTRHAINAKTAGPEDESSPLLPVVTSDGSSFLSSVFTSAFVSVSGSVVSSVPESSVPGTSVSGSVVPSVSGSGSGGSGIASGVIIRRWE